jgi:hypothetical protein
MMEREEKFACVIIALAVLYMLSQIVRYFL